MAQIDHLVVLMLENRSFDSLLGQLYLGREDFDGLTGNETNTANGHSYKVWSSPAGPLDTHIPTPDPAYFFLGFRLAVDLAWARSDPATDFSDLLDLLLLSSFEAFDAGFFPVTITHSEDAWGQQEITAVLHPQLVAANSASREFRPPVASSDQSKCSLGASV
jgi:hypothetical protein